MGGQVQYALIADPLATSTPSLRITRLGYPKRDTEELLADLVKSGILSPELATAIDGAVQDGSGIVVVGPSIQIRTRILSAVVSEIPETQTTCMFSLPGLAPRVGCPTMHMDRRLLSSGHGFLSDLISSFAPDRIIGVELQHQEFASHDGLLTALIEGGSLVSSIKGENAQSFIQDLEMAMGFSSPGTSAEDSSKNIARAVTLIIETPDSSKSLSSKDFTGSWLVYKDGTLQLNPISS